MRLVQTAQKLFDDLTKQYTVCNDNLNTILNNSFQTPEDIDTRVKEFNIWYTQEFLGVNSTYVLKKKELENLEEQYNNYITNLQKNSANVQVQVLEAIKNDCDDEIEAINVDTAKLIEIETQKKQEDLLNSKESDEDIIKRYNNQVFNLESQKNIQISTQKSIRDTMLEDTKFQFNNNKEKLDEQQQNELNSFQKLKSENLVSIEQLQENIRTSYLQIESFNTFGKEY
jgi:hypothetical protein